jgi:23S rRNA pseudouridine2605 synthase
MTPDPKDIPLVPADEEEAPRIEFSDVVSGQFDAELAKEEVTPLKRVLLPQAESPKLHKVLAQSGLGSRIEMERLIADGLVSVNQEPAHVGQRVQFGDQIKVNGKLVKVRIAPPAPRVIAYHKPAGEVVTHDDPQNRPTVFRRLPRLYQGKWQSVGRLDLNTEGLLLLTSSGELANQLMHPRFGLEREYAVRSLGKLSNEQKQSLLDGITLEDGLAQFGSIEEGGGEGSNCWYRVTISEGRNREVRRMFEAVGHAVSRLIRIRYGAMVLPRGLKRGAFVELREYDIRALMQAAGAKAPLQSGLSQDNRAERANSRRRGNSVGPRPSTPRQPEERSSGPERLVRARPNKGAAPDPLKTSVGYIGAESLAMERQRKKAGEKAFRAGLVGKPKPRRP